MTTLLSSTREDPPDAASRKVLTFGLGGEIDGVDILRVREIRGWSPVTRLPNSPSHVLGALNLRGSIVPIVDLRVCLGLERAEFTPVTVIIVLSVTMPGGRGEYWLVVDNVADVIDIGAGGIAECPRAHRRHRTRFY
jgi:purine-binding chemotaxis protein CheW